MHFGAGGLVVGVIIASYNISRTLLSPFVGRFSDRFGRKNFILAGLALYSAVSFAYVLADSPGLLIGVRLAHGLASLLVAPICMALAGDIAPKGRLGAYLGTVNTALMAGLGLGPSLGGFLFEHFGMHSAFYGHGYAVPSLTGVLVAFFLPPDRGKRGRGGATRKTATLREIFSHRTAVALVLMRFFAAIGQGAVYTLSCPSTPCRSANPPPRSVSSCP